MKKDKYKKVAEIFEKISVTDESKNCEAIFCKLHDKDHLGVDAEPDNESFHNCLACQLNEGNERIHRFLIETDTGRDGEYNFTIYILLLYLQVEKLHTIFKVIGITYEYVELKWKVLIEIRKWANFIKHPKGFLFTHHPSYLFEDDSYETNPQTKVLDYKFVHQFYYKENEALLKENIKQLSNKSNVLVIIPCPLRLAKDYAVVCKEFCDKIKKNPHFKEILQNHSTASDVF